MNTINTVLANSSPFEPITTCSVYSSLTHSKNMPILQSRWHRMRQCTKVCAEGWDDSFVDSWVAKHLDVVHFQNVWSSPGKGHFPVSVGELNSWVRAVKISLFKAKRKKAKLTRRSYHLVKNINTSQILVTNEKLIHSDILHLLFKEECEAVVHW